MDERLIKKAQQYIKTLCLDIPNRSVGSPGNLAATEFLKEELAGFQWEIREHRLDALDWEEGESAVTIKDKVIHVKASPYSKGCEVKAELVCISHLDELEKADICDRIVLLHGEIAREQLMPKNFVFYNPDEHKKIISLLESKKPSAVICATGRNSSLAGGPHPFPLIEDGDFDIPSVYMKDIEGDILKEYQGEKIHVLSTALRKHSRAFNISGLKGSGNRRIILSAHIDAKKGSPGAIDNATGVAILILLAELLRDYTGRHLLEIVAFNGEDYYAVPGQMDFIRRNENRFGDILLNINIDGAGYHEGDTAFSFFGVPDDIREFCTEVINNSNDASTGPEWPQGDHSIFVQSGVPAIAVSSLWLITNMENQTITHTEDDNPGIIDHRKVVNAAEMIAELIIQISG